MHFSFTERFVRWICVRKVIYIYNNIHIPQDYHVYSLLCIHMKVPAPTEALFHDPPRSARCSDRVEHGGGAPEGERLYLD